MKKPSQKDGRGQAVKSDRFVKKKKYKKKQENGLKCNLCPEEMNQNHCLICPERCDMRRGLHMSILDNLVTYFEDFLSDKLLR